MHRLAYVSCWKKNIYFKFILVDKIIITILALFYTVLAQSQTLLSNGELDTCAIYTSVEEAVLNPEKVFVLDLSANNLDVLPKELEKLTNIQRINLSNNRLRGLPDFFFELKTLQEINLEENKLDSLPAKISNLTNLKKLNLTRTKIPTIPASFSKLVNLKELNLSWNNLKPDSILAVFDLTQLEDLNLMRNQLNVLDDRICKFNNLLYLNLNFNPLSKLPEQFGNLTQLIELDLGKNTELKSLPESFKKLVNLEYLNLKSVPLPFKEKQKLPKLDEDVIEF